MKILIDMNLSPFWVPVLRQAGHQAVHWSKVGAPDAPDRLILDWAKTNGYVVFTHDLDFGAILAASQGLAPSVVQIRIQDVTPEICSGVLLDAITRFQGYLEKGSLVTVDENRARVRVLPLGGDDPRP